MPPDLGGRWADGLAPASAAVYAEATADGDCDGWIDPSAELGPGGDGIVDHNQVQLLLALLGVYGRDEHAVGL